MRSALSATVIALSLGAAAAETQRIGGFASADEMHAAWETYGVTAVPPGRHVIMGRGPHAPAAVLGGGQAHAGGAAWTRAPNDADEWVLEARVRIDGAADAGGAGMALWYAAEKGAGPVMGAPDAWRGLGIVVDTFDDDRDGTSPAIMGIMNDGSARYNAAGDGSGQYFAGCVRGMRNEEHPVALRLSYARSPAGGRLKLELGDAPAGEAPHWATCFDHDGIALPPGYFFGVSAGTNEHPDAVSVFDVALSVPKKEGPSALYSAVGELHAAAKAAGAHMERGHHEVHAQNETHLRELHEHVSSLSRGLQHVAGSIDAGHEATEALASEIRADVHGLREELHAHMARIQEHFAREHGAAHATVHAHAAPHAAPGWSLHSGYGVVGVAVLLEVALLAGFLFVKGRMDSAKRFDRKWC